MARIRKDSGAAITNMEPGKRGATVLDVVNVQAGVARVRELGGSADEPMPVPGMGWFAIHQAALEREPFHSRRTLPSSTRVSGSARESELGLGASRTQSVGSPSWPGSGPRCSRIRPGRSSPEPLSSSPATSSSVSPIETPPNSRSRRPDDARSAQPRACAGARPYRSRRKLRTIKTAFYFLAILLALNAVVQALLAMDAGSRRSVAFHSALALLLAVGAVVQLWAAQRFANRNASRS